MPETRAFRVKPIPLAGNAKDDTMRALDTAESVLKLQSESFARRGITPPAAPSVLGELALQLARSKGEPVDHNSLLYALLTELQERQNGIAALDKANSVEVSVEAFVGVAHRIRTALDVILACSGEIEDLVASPGATAELERMNREIGRRVRWVLQHTNELNDLAQLGKIKPGQPVLTNANDAMQSVANRLSALARYSDITLSVSPGERLALYTNPHALERCLHYLTLVALSAESVREVRLSARASVENDVPMLSFVVEDNGRGDSLGERARLQAASPIGGDGATAADGAGFAMARKLARVIGGSIQLEITPSKGATSTLKLPRET